MTGRKCILGIGKYFLVEFFAWAEAGVFYLDVFVWDESGELNHSFSEICNLHR